MKLLPSAACLFALLSASPALAHSFLVKAAPGVGSTVSTPPTSLLMTYTEGLEVPFCGVTVADASGATVQKGKPQAVPGHSDEMSVPLNITRPGTFTVAWHAVSVDTHHTQGSFRFTVSQ